MLFAKYNVSNQMRETVLQNEVLQNLSLSRAYTKLKAEDRRAVQDITKKKVTNLSANMTDCCMPVCSLAPLQAGKKHVAKVRQKSETNQDISA